jgi:hypothetical protein
MMEENDEMCLIDNATTNLTLREKISIKTLLKRTENIITIVDNNDPIVGFGQAIVVLRIDTRIFIEEAFLYSGATCTLLAFKDISCNGYHITIVCKGYAEYHHQMNVK